RNATGDHAPKLGTDPQHVPVQRHRASGDQRAMRDGGRSSHRAYAGRPPLRRGDDLSRRRRVRAIGRLDDLLTRRPGMTVEGRTARDEGLWRFTEIGGYISIAGSHCDHEAGTIMWNRRRTLQTGLATLLSAAAPLRAF